MDSHLQSLLSAADLALGRLDGSVTTLPSADRFVFMYVRKEAVLSSQIEGTQSSLQDLLRAEAQIDAPDQPRDVADLVSYVRAMNHGLSRLSQLPVSIRLIREIHAELMTGARGGHLRPGELRTAQNWIGPPGSTVETAMFVPPPPHVVPSALADLERYLHAPSDAPPLIRIALAHAQFETIHPFLDGNGRIGRLLISFLLTEEGILAKPVLYLSHYFKRHRQEYYDALQRIRDAGDWEGWLAFVLTGIATVAEAAADTARRILALREEHRDLIVTHLGRASGNGLRVLEHLYRHPIVSVTEVQDVNGTSFAAANTLVARLAKMGLLTEVTGHSRNRRFRYDPYVDLFVE